MLCLTADVGGTWSSNYNIPVDLLNPAQGTILTWNKVQSVLQLYAVTKEESRPFTVRLVQVKEV